MQIADDFIKHINDFIGHVNDFIPYVNKYNNVLQMSEFNNDTLQKCIQVKEKCVLILNILKNNTICLTEVIENCDNLIFEITNNIEAPKKSDIYVHQTIHGLLNIPVSHRVENKYSNIYESTNTYKNIFQEKYQRKFQEKKVFLPEIDYHTNIHYVKKLSDIPNALYYYEDIEDKNKTGVYIKLGNNNLFRIPFPKIVNFKDNGKKNSIRCKYKTVQECKLHKNGNRKIYNRNITNQLEMSCNFAHSGDNIIKIGYSTICPNVPDYGNPTTFKYDINKINELDVKNLLMYGLSDILNANIWLNHKSVSNVMEIDLDIC